MEILEDKDYKVSDTTYLKILKELKSELKDNVSNIKKLNEIDYKYNKKIVNVQKLIDIIDDYMEDTCTNKKTKNYIVSYYGEPLVTIQICILALLNCQRVNLLIDDFCLGVNKLIVELFNDILNDYRIENLVSLDNFKSKNDIDSVKDQIDKMYCLGNYNVYTVCKKIDGLNIEYVPFNNLDIYCENPELEELSQKILETCLENGIEAEVYEDMDIDEAIDSINNYGKKYCSIILTKNDDYMNRFKKEVKSKFVFINENPLKKETFLIPKIF